MRGREPGRVDRHLGLAFTPQRYVRVDAAIFQLQQIRLVAVARIGQYYRKVQSAVISSGSELEAMVAALVPNIPNLDAFLEQEIMPDGVLLARKRQIKQSTTLDFAGSEPDFMVFKRRGGVQTCHIVELKDGHVFAGGGTDMEDKAYPSEPGLTTCWVCGCHRRNVRLMFCHAQPLEVRPPDVPHRLRGALSR